MEYLLDEQKLSRKMSAINKYEHVIKFEVRSKDICLPNCWIGIRIDGKRFHRFSEKHNFSKPNDERSLGLMTKSAIHVMQEFQDVLIAYGQSDEYSFILKKDTDIYDRRVFKLVSTFCSAFTASYVFNWTDFFPDEKLQYLPAFDGRISEYPSNKDIRDYLSYRQVDCHINNLYNTAFWTLVNKGNLSPAQAKERLQEKKTTTEEKTKLQESSAAEKKTKSQESSAAEKNEILFSFGINYNNEPELFKKGTVIIRKKSGTGKKTAITPLNVDIIGDKFWEEHSYILKPYS